MITIEEFVDRLCRLGVDRGPRRFPRRRRDREILFKSLRMAIDERRAYREPEINELIRTWRREVAPAIETDHVTIRRLLIDDGHLERTADGRRYRLGFPPGLAVFDLDVDSLDLPATVAAYRHRTRPPTPVVEVNALLGELVDGARGVLGADLVGAYLVGSTARGDADAHSDVDFVIATAGALDLRRVAALAALHARLLASASPFAERLDGLYVPTDRLRRGDPAHRPLLRVEPGRGPLVASPRGHHLSMRWALRRHGVTLLGPAARTLVDPIDADALREDVRDDLARRAAAIHAAPARLDDAHAQPALVRTLCRMLHTLERAEVVSKPAAARWALGALPARWRPLIEHALAARGDPSAAAGAPADPEALAATRDFVAFTLDRSATGPAPRDDGAAHR